jgi:hypothetical protein
MHSFKLLRRPFTLCSFCEDIEHDKDKEKTSGIEDSVKCECESASEYCNVLKSDQKLYPTQSPLTVQTLKDWHANNKDFGIIFYYMDPSTEREVIVGNVIMVALHPDRWKSFVDGKDDLSESSLIYAGKGSSMESYLYNPSTSSTRQFAVHIYHMEKSQEWANITDYNLRATSSDIFAHMKLGQVIMHDIQEITLRLESMLVGISGLAVTESGYKVMKTVFGCTLSYPSKEFVVEEFSTGTRSVVHESELIRSCEWKNASDIKIGDVVEVQRREGIGEIKMKIAVVGICRMMSKIC